MESTGDKNENLVTCYHKREIFLESDTDGDSMNLTIDDGGNVVVIKLDKQCQSNNDLNTNTTNVVRTDNEQFESVHRVKEKLTLSEHVPTDIRDIFSKAKRIKGVDGEIRKTGADNQDTSNNNYREQPNSEKQKPISIYNRCKNWANKVARKVSSYYYVLVNNLRESETEKNKDQKKLSKRPTRSKDNDDDNKNLRIKKNRHTKDEEEKKRNDYLNAALRIKDF